VLPLRYSDRFIKRFFPWSTEVRRLLGKPVSNALAREPTSANKKGVC